MKTGPSLMEDGLVTEYDAPTKRHTVKWLGGINLELSDYPADVDAEVYRHDLMMLSKQMWTPTTAGKRWKQTPSILIKWYYDEDVEYGTEAGE